jgi:large subunit ribosomal protein L32
MAVPKRKKSKSRRNMRRASNGSYKLEFPNVVTDETTGEFKLPHHISSDGYYKGRKIIADKQKKAPAQEQ